MKTTEFCPAALQPELQTRYAKLRALMQRDGLQAMLISSNANLYYTALRFFRGYVYLPLEGDALYFVIRPNNLEGPGVQYIRKPEQIMELLPGRPERLGLEFDTLSMSEGARLEKAFPGVAFANCSGLLKESRMTKTDWELEQMRYDGRHQAAAYGRVRSVYREGMTDVEFQIEIERLLRLEGSIGYYRTAGNLMEISMGSLINGENADAPTPYDFAMGGGGVNACYPVGANGTTMLPGTSVMVDMNGAFNGYQTDMTRVWTIGPVSDLAHKAHNCSLRILRRIEEVAKAGVHVADLYHEAEKIVAQEELEKYFMGHAQHVAFIGHGVGIELNEPPVVMARSRDTLQEGMTLAIEPKFVIPHVGAVGAENTYAVHTDGLENLTSFPEQMEDILG